MSKLSEALDVITNYVYDANNEKTVKKEWKPISSAPKDGRRLLVTWEATWEDDIHIEVCSFERSGWYYVYDGDRAPDPTHWMKLPEKP